MKRTTKLSKKRKLLLHNESQEVLRRHEAADSHRIVCAATGGMSERVKNKFSLGKFVTARCLSQTSQEL